MSSAFALAFSHSLSSSKELGGLFWSLTAVLHVVSVVFAPGADLSTSSVVVNRGFEATTLLSLWSFLRHAHLLPGHSAIHTTAADEAPPPPPPDDGPGVTNKPDGCKKPFGWLVWLWWLILHVFKWLYKIPCIALQTAFKIIWVYTGPVFWMGVKYYIPPVFILQTINLFGLGPPVASYSGPYVFKTAMYLLNGNMASTILTVISTWVFVYPFFKFGFNLLLDINTYLCLSPALLRWILFSPVQFIRAWLRAANTIRRWTVAFYRRLPDGYGTNMVLCWEWLIVPTVNRLSALQIYSLFFPPVLHVIYTDMYSDARCIRMVEYKLYKRIAELETRLENVAR
ncbi:hypothetical protein B0H10DRAFT_2211960 [Mycena sp. CBHHK59/15]|nr:hypothetical protein B0H10DRAFT_2211960 [Mycena sp. CBHHK59/15]